LSSPLANAPEVLLDLAVKAGAEAAEVFWTTSQSHPVTFEANRLKQVESIELSGLGLRMWVAGRCGIAVAYGAVEPEQLVEKAKALSEWGRLEASLPVDRNPPTWQLEAPAVDAKTLVEQGRHVIAQLRDHYPDVLCSGEWSYGTETLRLVNTQGVDCSFTDYSIEGYISAEWVRGDDFLEVSAGQLRVPRPQQPMLPLDTHRWLAELGQRLDWATSTVAIPSGRYPVLFLPSAAATLLDPIAAALSGRHIAQRSSPWARKVGEVVTSERITLVQNPLLGPFGTPFDDEGTPCEAMTFIEQGRLQQVYGDRHYAQIVPNCSAGNGFCSSLGSLPGPGIYNLLLPEANTSLSEAIASMERGLVVDQVLGDSNGLSGDLSVTLELAYWVERGEVVGRIKDTMLAGNCYTLLRQLAGFASVGLHSDDDSREWVGQFYMPALWVEDVAVTSSRG
jgi:PmbA protein